MTLAPSPRRWLAADTLVVLFAETSGKASLVITAGVDSSLRETAEHSGVRGRRAGPVLSAFLPAGRGPGASLSVTARVLAAAQPLGWGPGALF